jgi:hypothetical protein
VLCLRAWHDLHSERSQGFAGAGLIPWSSIIEWADVHGLDRESALLLVDVIRRLDHDRAEAQGG